MSNLKEKIIKKIEKGEIKKTSRLYFLIKKYFFWTSFILSTFLGAVSFSIFLKNYFDDFGPWYKLKIENSFFLSNIFWFWILSILIFILVAILNFKQTKKAFHFKSLYVILGTIFISLVFGGIFYQLKIGNKIEAFILNHNQRYKTMKIERENIIFDYLEKNNINPQEFFGNEKVLKKRKEWQKVDEERIKRLRKILEASKGQKNEKELRELFEKIKKKKREIDYQRFLKEVEIYNQVMLR